MDMEKIFWLCLLSLSGTLFPFKLAAQTNTFLDAPILSPQLAERLLAEGNSAFTLIVKLKDKNSQRYLQQKFPQAKWEAYYYPVKAYQVEVASEEITAFLSQEVLFADYHHQAPQEELAVSFYDPRVNQISLLQSQWGHLYNGDSLVCSIKEYRFDSLDIDLKGRYQSAALASRQTTQHANAMASLIGGAGYNFYTAKGVAPNVQLSSSSFLQLLPDHDSIMLANQISVQNHSYGIGIESYYGLEAAAYDRQAERIPHLLHIFSAGNEGQSAAAEGPYADIASWANLTGNFKQAKNVLIVGAVDSMRQPVPLSAVGPAHDGRIKPEIVAFGEGGSSESAALVSGTAIILQDIYRQQHNGALPSSAWTKAILCNSADDVDRPGPDYKSGFGNLNAFQASKDALSMRYVEDSIQDGQQLKYSITLPAGTQNLKLMLAWIDPAAAPLNTKALVHDLELSLFHADSNQNWLPWTLNSSPHPDSLEKGAKRGKDHLNPLEQISVFSPYSGTYEIRVDGLEIDSAWQRFALVWSWQEAESFEWLSPSKRDYFIAGAEQAVFWKSNISPDKANLQYRFCSPGSSWTDIAEDISPTAQYYRWQMPDTLALMQVRLLADQESFVSDTFVCGTSFGLDLDVECEGEILLSWEDTQGIHAYELFAYDGSEIISKGRYQENYAWLSKDTAPEKYFAIAPIMSDDQIGLRSPLLFLDFQSGSCFVQQFFARLEVDQVQLDLNLGTTQEISQIHWERKGTNGFEILAVENIILSTALTYLDRSPIEGPNLYRARVVLVDGSNILSDEQLILYVRQGRYLVAPNPIEWGFEIIVEGPIQEGSTFELVDTQGRIVSVNVLDVSYKLIPTDQLPRGIYLFRIKNQGKLIEKGKLLIQ